MGERERGKEKKKILYIYLCFIIMLINEFNVKTDNSLLFSDCENFTVWKKTAVKYRV